MKENKRGGIEFNELLRWIALLIFLVVCIIFVQSLGGSTENTLDNVFPWT